MGHLSYASTTTPIPMDDHVLAHVRSVVVTKLRREESFALTVPTSANGAETLWIHAAIPLRFDLDSDVTEDRELLVAMMAAANSAGGLDLTDDRLVVTRPDSH